MVGLPPRRGRAGFIEYDILEECFFGGLLASAVVNGEIIAGGIFYSTALEIARAPALWNKTFARSGTNCWRDAGLQTLRTFERRPDVACSEAILAKSYWQEA